jgi:hypothetical protein
MAKIGKYQVPFDSNGNLLHYAGYGQVDWRDNHPFRAQLKLDGMTSGYSAKYLKWVDINTGHRYSMFVADLIELLNERTVSKGLTMDSLWVVRKRGNNYGIVIYQPDFPTA